MDKWISVFWKGFLGVAEIANFENLATQDTLWVSSLFFFLIMMLTHQILLKESFY